VSATLFRPADLKHLKGLTQLQKLNLGWTEVDAAGLEHLKALTKLQRLEIQGGSHLFSVYISPGIGKPRPTSASFKHRF